MHFVHSILRNRFLLFLEFSSVIHDKTTPKVPLFAILLQLISYYIDELLVRTMMLINHLMGRRILGINRMKIIYFIIG